MTNMTLVAYIKEILDSGDPLIRSWTLVDSYSLPFVMSAIYVFLMTRLGPTIMKNRKPFDLRNFMILYNFFIVFSYTGCLLVLVYLFFTTDGYKKICSPVKININDYTYKASTAAWIIYVLKYVEYADTVFFVLRKKFHLITNLHVIHHSILPIICWFFLRTEKSGFQLIPGVINSFIHIVMYTYYGLAAMGPQVQKYLWWKEYLTRLQMLQFVLVLIFVLVIIPLSGCKISKHGSYMDIFFATLFLSLFYNFYTKTYKKSPVEKINPKSSTKSQNGHSSNDGKRFENCPGENGFMWLDQFNNRKWWKKSS